MTMDPRVHFVSDLPWPKDMVKVATLFCSGTDPHNRVTVQEHHQTTNDWDQVTCGACKDFRSRILGRIAERKEENWGTDV